MLAYWLLFLIPAWMALSQPARAKSPPKHTPYEWILTGAVCTAVIGWRHEVGGDWASYLEHYDTVALISLPEVLRLGDPGYYLLVWIFAEADFGIHALNLLFGLFFTIGLMSFCRSQPRPWLALAVAVPYLVIVLGMGYTRQGVALGFAMLGMVRLERGKTLQFIGWVMVGALFHRSAIVLIPLAAIATSRSRVSNALWAVVAAAALYWGLLADDLERFVTIYVDAEMQSEGAAVRVAMNVLPGILLLLYRARARWLSSEQRILWTIISLLAVASAGWLFLSPSSTAVDRLALYLIPLQLFVFARLPDLLNISPGSVVWVALVLAYYALVLAVWLLFATHAFAWIPYQFYPAVIATE